MSQSIGVPAFCYFGYIVKSRIAVLRGNSMFKFLANCHTVSHSGYMKDTAFIQAAQISLDSGHPVTLMALQ
jgi:hypothetical protein